MSVCGPTETKDTAVLRYFVAGNLWLLAAVVLFIGRTFERSQPTRYSIFGAGRLLSPTEYGWMIAVVALLSAACFWRYTATRSRSAE